MSSDRSSTRENILNAAWRLLEKDGGEVRMADIAKAAGVSRQAVYLHFPARADLLIATTRHIDEVKGVDERLARSRNARGGVERLDAFIEAWGNYIPEIHGVGRALMSMAERDDAAREAWDDRMTAVRDGCRAAVEALGAEGLLAAEHTVEEATDLLWTLLSVPSWDALTVRCGWPQATYVAKMQGAARRVLTDAGAMG